MQPRLWEPGGYSTVWCSTHPVKDFCFRVRLQIEHPSAWRSRVLDPVMTNGVDDVMRKESTLTLSSDSIAMEAASSPETRTRDHTVSFWFANMFGLAALAISLLAVCS